MPHPEDDTGPFFSDYTAGPEVESQKATFSVSMPVVTAAMVAEHCAQIWMANYAHGDRLTNMLEDKLGIVLQQLVDSLTTEMLNERIETLLDKGWMVTGAYGRDARRVNLVEIVIEHLKGDPPNVYNRQPSPLEKIVATHVEKAVYASFAQDGIFGTVLVDARKKLVGAIDLKLVEALRNVIKDTLGSLA